MKEYAILYCRRNATFMTMSHPLEKLQQEPTLNLYKNGCQGLCGSYEEPEWPSCRIEFWGILREGGLGPEQSLLMEEGDTFIRGSTEREFVENLAKATGLNLDSCL